MVHDRKWENILLLSFKIAIASFLSIFTAELLHLQYARFVSIRDLTGRRSRARCPGPLSM